jgi:large subunit ribosomal protein L15
LKLHEIEPASGSRKNRKRVGRGLGSGHGKTSGRGQKGQGARTSVNLPKMFEGGQTKLSMRIPKLRGFNNRWKKTFSVVNLSRLNRFEEGAQVTPEKLLEVGVLKDVGAGLKVLGSGDLNRRLIVRAHRFSEEARKKIEASGGTVEVIPVPPPIRPKTKRAKVEKSAKAAPAPDGEQPEKGAAPARDKAASGKAEKSSHKAEKSSGKAPAKPAGETK